MFTVKNIGNLSKEASQKAIMLPLKNSDINFTNELIDAIMEKTLGYPYLLQFYPYYLIQNVPKKKTGVKEFKEMYPLLLRELDESFFSGRFNKASDSEQRILFEMARLAPEMRFSELREKAKIDKNYLNQILISLIEKGLIFRVGRGKYRFTLPLFGLVPTMGSLHRGYLSLMHCAREETYHISGSFFDGTYNSSYL